MKLHRWLEFLLVPGSHSPPTHTKSGEASGSLVLMRWWVWSVVFSFCFVAVAVVFRNWSPRKKCVPDRIIRLVLWKSPPGLSPPPLSPKTFLVAIGFILKDRDGSIGVNSNMVSLLPLAVFHSRRFFNRSLSGNRCLWILGKLTTLLNWF